MRAPIAYFAGAGTVIAAIGIGLGGGLTIANVMSPHQDKLEQTKLDQRMSAKPVPPSAQVDQPKLAEQAKPAVPYVAATNAAIDANTPPTPAQPQSQTQAAVPAPQPSPQPAETKVATDPPVTPAEPKTAKAQPAAREQPTAPRDQASSEDTNAKPRSPEDANASARESDLKRLAAEKRKAERRQKWADRKKAQQQRDAELRGAGTSASGDADGPRIVRRDADGPRIVFDDDSDRPRDVYRRDRGNRGDADRPFGFPGFNLFGGDRD